MRVPGFNAEASLHRIRHYGAIGKAIDSTAKMSGKIHPAERIEVYGCNPGFLELGEGENMVCIPDPSWGGGGGAPHGGEHEPTGGGPGSGGGGGRPRPPSPAERKKLCKQCKANADKCLAQAQLAERTCSNNAKTMAASRCEVSGRHEVGETVTPWGCSISDLVAKNCPQAEPPWNNPTRWGYDCLHPPDPCTGPGINNCMSSWRQSHLQGTEQITETGQLSAMFEGVGAQGGQTFTETYTWNGRTGYAAVCTTVGSNLSHKCTGQQNSCYIKNSCTTADLE
jgi:hypothetical protein